MVGSTRMFLGLLHDVTELIEALSLAESCFSEANDPMVVVDEHGTIKHWNHCATATFKYPGEEAIGQNITFIMPEPHRSQHGDYLKRYLTTGEARVIGKPRNVPVITATGEVLVCSLKVSCLLKPFSEVAEVRGRGSAPYVCAEIWPILILYPYNTGERDQGRQHSTFCRPAA